METKLLVDPMRLIIKEEVFEIYSVIKFFSFEYLMLYTI